jgi:hypothetical protein
MGTDVRFATSGAFAARYQALGPARTESHSLLKPSFSELLSYRMEIRLDRLRSHCGQDQLPYIPSLQAKQKDVTPRTAWPPRDLREIPRLFLPEEPASIKVVLRQALVTLLVVCTGQLYGVQGARDAVQHACRNIHDLPDTIADLRMRAAQRVISLSDSGSTPTPKRRRTDTASTAPDIGLPPPPIGDGKTWPESGTVLYETFS